MMGGRTRSRTPAGQEPLAKVSDTRLAELAVESGMTSGSAVKMCVDLVVSGAGGPKDLAEALISQAVLTEQQVHVLEQVAREGGKANFLGAYQLLEKLGEGGMGAVFKARQVALDRLVALKILPERLSGNAEFVSRFELESRAAAKIDHPNVVRAIDAGKASGKYYFAMEFVEGASIEDILEECRVIPEEKAIGIMIQAARGLESAWKRKLIHRDIKPDNILITEDGVAKIADLGLAREIDTVDTRLTQDGAAMGTPHYISPEQARGEEVDIRTDIYALGVTLYRMVTGEFPFSGKDPVSIIMARFHETPRAANELRDDVSDELAQVIATMMAPDRELRYPDPVVLQHDLELLARGEEPEYASSNQELRAKALQEARSRRSGTTTLGLIVVKKRNRRDRAFIAGGAVVALAIIVAALLVLARKDTPGPTPPHIPGTALSEEEIAARKALEAEAAAFHEKLTGLFDDEKYAEVVAGADEAGTKYAGTPHGPKVDSLRRQAADKLAEIKRREEEEAEKEKRYAELVRQARENLALKDHATAAALLTQAKAIKETEEVEALFAEAKRLQYVDRAEDAERRAKLAEAVNFYGLALELRDDADLRARVAELERRFAFAEKVAEGDAHVERREWLAARDDYTDALEIAKDEERPPVERKLGPVGAEIAYLGLLTKARESAAAGNWPDVLGSATRASEVKPDEDEPRKLILQARRAVGPEKRIANSLGMEFVLVPAGAFTMGSDTGDPDEKPRREVHLDAYYIGVHEVTNAQYEMFRQRHQRTAFSPADDTPVVAVSWTEACDFCEWLSEKEGIEHRLPTEAEWEKAACGEDGREFPWGPLLPTEGEAPPCNTATEEQRQSWLAAGSVDAEDAKALPVGSFAAGESPLGCMDMAGNVWEWCLDWYRGDYYAGGENLNPQGPPTGKHRVHRGGSFGTLPGSARCANRAGHPPDFMEASVGFRVVRALDPIFLDSDLESGTGGEDEREP
jgi:serine/threonine-protein kinase